MEDFTRECCSKMRMESRGMFGVRVTIKTAFSKALKAAGLADFHLHDCRHTAITRLIRAGMSPVKVIRVSGHTTMSAFYRYANVDMETVFRLVTLLDALNAGVAGVALRLRLCRHMPLKRWLKSHQS